MISNQILGDFASPLEISALTLRTSAVIRIDGQREQFLSALDPRTIYSVED